MAEKFILHSEFLHQETGGFQHADAGDQPDIAGNRRQKDGFLQNQRNQRQRRRAERLANADFFRAFFDNDQHNITDADHARKHCAAADDPHENIDAAKQPLQFFEFCAGIPRANRAFVIWRDKMPLSEQVFRFGLNRSGRNVGIRRDLNRPDMIPLIIRHLQRGQRQINPLRLALRVADARDIKHADHQEIETFDQQIFPDRVFILEQHFRHFRANDRHFALFVKINLIQKSAFFHGEMAQFEDCRKIAVDGIRAVFVLIADRVFAP